VENEADEEQCLVQFSTMSPADLGQELRQQIKKQKQGVHLALEQVQQQLLALA
jgi:hypothetical protein